jgi:acid phosphatase type 7
MHLPFFYWTLITPFATFIGLYSNVPEHGQLDPAQRAWFQAQMKDADKNKALVVAVHHPIYSFDTYHSGSPNMAKELQDAINSSRRLPNLVLNAHVHNYQRIELQVAGHTIPFLVIGNGGYWNLHHLGAAPGYKDPETEAELKAGIDSRHGFMTFEISDKVINGHFTTVPRPQESWTDAEAYNAHFDVFSYSAVPMFLQAGQTVTLVPPDGVNVPPHTDHTAHRPARSGTSQAKVDARAAHATRTAHKVHAAHGGHSRHS